MTTKTFQRACAALWGPQYRSEAARLLGIGLRSMMRYDAGERTVPPVLMERLAKLLKQRQAQIEKVLPQVAAAGEAA